MFIRSLVALTLLCTPALARDFSDPSWPCIQRKVPRLSYGVVWPEVIEEGTLDTAAQDLADTLALRRVSLDDAETAIDAFAATGPDHDAFAQVFLAAFTRMDRDRTRLVKGIERYSLSQVALSEKIAGIRAEMEAIMTTDQPDFDRVDALEETLDWNSRIFKDRQSVLTYVCESPVLLEKRIYAVGQMLLAKRP